MPSEAAAVMKIAQRHFKEGEAKDKILETPSLKGGCSEEQKEEVLGQNAHRVGRKVRMLQKPEERDSCK